ncbi:MAG: NUDIX hydrolase [Methylophilales bacterium RIFCSPHIGHO2_02_FULL_57_10]|nr:MAG: NUDIX hydrolase [Methylophilales bacterium RIFCSPHIGHO2_02_FULL_57_10]
MIWKPNVTVAAVIKNDGKFLLVEEETADGVMFNQPAGHLEEGETLLEAVRREAWEETAHRFEPTALLGVYHWKHPSKDITYLRFAFLGTATGHDPEQPLDAGILRAVWMTPEEIRATQDRHRSPQVLTCIEHYLVGQRFPLSVLTHL